jgi:hypothetical protein
MSVWDYSGTASSNTAIGGNSIAENGPRDKLNDAMRQMAADVYNVTSARCIDEFSGSTTDQKITAACAAGKAVHLKQGVTYTLDNYATIAAGSTLYLNGATVQAKVAFADNHLLQMAGSAKIIGPGTIDGTNIPVPTGSYSSGSYKGVAVFISGTQADGRIENVTFQNCPSGPILNDSASAPTGFQVVRCAFLTNQTYTSNETNALVHFHAVSNGRQIDCRASGYNWKGFYAANGNFNQIVGCDASGGAVGHASHYITGGTDNQIINCTHTGTGFGFKCFNTTRPRVIGFVSKSARAGGLFEGCSGLVGHNISVYDPAIPGLSVYGLSGFVTGGRISNFYCLRPSAGTTSDHTGITVQAVSGGIIDNLTIDGWHADSTLYGIYVVNTGFQQTGINILNGRTVSGGQYGVLAFLGSGRIERNDLQMDGAAVAAGITVASDGVTTTGRLRIADNEISACTADNIQIGETSRFSYDQLEIMRNRANGGATFLDYQGNANAADRVKKLRIIGNAATDLTTAGMTLTFNGTTSTVAEIYDNDLRDTSLVPVADTLTTLTNVEFAVRLKYTGTPEAAIKARIGTEYVRLDGGASTTHYFKESGTSNTGWVAK